MNLKPIYGKESKEMEEQLSHFICEHNLLVDILKVFEENRTAKEFFENAREEVLDSGNAGLNSMYVIALENLASKAKAYLDDEYEVTDTDKLNSRIWALEKENRMLKMKVESIEKILKGEK